MSGALSSILWPVVAYALWLVVLYVWLTLARIKAVQRGEARLSTFALSREEPPWVARITKNLSNQFEWPTVFLFAVAILVALDRVVLADVLAAWVFLFGRVVHSLVQCLTDDVALRGRVFMINFLAALVPVGHLAVLAAQGVGVAR